MSSAEKLISEVGKRPALYNIHMREYSNNSIRSELWNEISAIMNDKWGKMNDRERIEYSKYLRRKWKHIRDEYQRENKILKATGGPKQLGKRKYAHYEKLHFLADFVESSPNYIKPLPLSARRSSEVSTSRSRSVSNASTPLPSWTESNVITSRTEPYIITSRTEPNIIASRTEPNMITLRTEPNISPPRTQPDFETRKRKRKSTKKDGLREIRAILTQSIQFEKDERELDKRGNKSFLLSLVPLMNSLEDEVITQTRIRILEVIQEASSFIIDRN